MEYYKSLGVIEFNKVTLPGSQPNDPLLTNLYIHDKKVNQLQVNRNEHLFVTDCFLKNMHKYKYIVNIDVDEIIMPLNESTWFEMMEQIEKDTKNQVFPSFLLEIFKNY